MDRLSAFAAILDRWASAASPVHRFSWTVQTLVGETLNPSEMVSEARKQVGIQPNPSLDLNDITSRRAQMAEKSMQHRVSFTISVHAKRVTRLAKHVGGVEEVLYDQLAEFFNALGLDSSNQTLGLKQGTFLGYNELILENRLALDPVFAKPLLHQVKATREGYVFATQHPAWPKFVDFSSDDYCRLGLTFHKGYYIAEMPRHGLLPTQLWQILSLDIPKTVTAVYEMLPIRQAERRARWATSATRSVNVDDDRADRYVSQAQHVREESMVDHEREIANNVGQVGRLRVYIDLNAPSLEQLEVNAARFETVAQDSRFLIEPLVGRQYEGIEVLMPACRGLATLSL